MKDSERLERELLITEVSLILKPRPWSSSDMEKIRYLTNKLAKVGIEEDRIAGTLDPAAFAPKFEWPDPVSTYLKNNPGHRHFHRWTNWIWGGHQMWVCDECGASGRKHEFVKRYKSPVWEDIEPEREYSNQEIWEMILA